MLGLLSQFFAILDTKLLCRVLLLQAGVGLAREVVPNSTTQFQGSLVTNCWNVYTQSPAMLSNSAFASVPLTVNQPNILSPENVAKFVISEPQHCINMINAVQGAYRSRPLMQRIFQIVLGLKHSVSFSFDPKIAPASGRAFPNIGSVILGYFKPFPDTTKSMIQSDIVYNAHALTRHEVTHLLDALYGRYNNEKFSSPEYFAKLISAYRASIEKLEKIEWLLKNDKNNPELQEFKALANAGSIPETEGLDQTRFLLQQKDALKTMINPILKTYEKTNPKHVADEMFAHIFHLFSENHIQNFFPEFYQTMHEMVESFEPYELTLHNAPLQTEAELRNYTYAMLEEKDNQHLKQHQNSSRVVLEKVYPYYREMQKYSQAYFENCKAKSDATAKEIISFYTQPGLYSVIDELAHTSISAQVRKTLALANHVIGNTQASYKNFNIALKKGGHEKFTDAELYIFSQVAQQNNKVINCSAARKRAEKLLQPPENPLQTACQRWFGF